MGGAEDTTGQTEADRLGWYKLVYSLIEDQIRLNRWRADAYFFPLHAPPYPTGIRCQASHRVSTAWELLAARAQLNLHIQCAPANCHAAAVALHMRCGRVMFKHASAEGANSTCTLLETAS